MAHIREQMVVLKVSMLVKDDEADSENLFTDEIVETVEAVVGELMGQGRVVEVIKDL